MNSHEGPQPHSDIHIDSLGKLHASDELGQLLHRIDIEIKKFPNLASIVTRCQTILDQLSELTFTKSNLKNLVAAKSGLAETMALLQTDPKKLTPEQILKAEAPIRIVAKLNLKDVDHLELLAMVKQISVLTDYWKKVADQQKTAASKAWLDSVTVR